MRIHEKSSDYHANEAIGSSLLKKIHSKTLLHAMTAVQQENDAMIMGGAVHCAILEPERFAREYIVAPDDAPKKPTDRQINAKKLSPESAAAVKYWKEFEERAQGKVILDADQMKAIEGMYASIMNHPIANGMLSGGEAEYSYYVEEPTTKMKLKCRPDYHNQGALIDIKTTNDASYEEFAKTIGKMGYHLQGAYYTDIFNASQGTNYDEFFFIAVENKLPFAVAVYRLDSLHLEHGRNAYKKALAKLALYKEGGSDPAELHAFHGYPAEIQDIQVPHWFLDRIGG